MPEPRMEREADLRCDGCAAAPYTLFRRQVVRADGSVNEVVWESVLWGNGGAGPPRDPTNLRCPSCGKDLRRVAA